MKDNESLTAIFPPAFFQGIDTESQITEIVLDLGRLPEIRYGTRKVFVQGPEVSEGLIKTVLSAVGTFGPDNRAGMARTLHRISRIVDRDGTISGLTIRVGRPVQGCVQIIEDLIREGVSVLLLGAPGVGKTTKLRDVCRLASTDLDKAVVIVDTSNEIAGDGAIPHPAVGRARRLQVPTNRTQHTVMQEAVENHAPQVLVVDEIGNRDEAEACGTFARRGVQLIATAHGQTLEELIQNPELRALVGGIKSAPVSDQRMEAKNLPSKFISQRIMEPTFGAIVEIINHDTVAVHRDVAAAVDCILRGGRVTAEIRETRDGDWEIRAKSRLIEPKPEPVASPVEDLEEEDLVPPTKRQRREKFRPKSKPHYRQQPGKKNRPRWR